jgi:2-keto-4-pentenoate hydratase/2-oxohepta-3-ene-1,7-dioic acid hydratase in catechol pathway
MRFVIIGETARLGILDGDRVLDLAKAAATTRAGRSFTSLLELIEAGEQGLDAVRAIAEAARGAPDLFTPVATTPLSAPWPGQRLALAGNNNAAHGAHAFANLGGKPFSEEQFREMTRKGSPGGFWASARPVMGPGAKIEIPSRALGFFDYEGEPAFVIGKRGKDIKAKDAKSYIWGVTLVVDWSIREEGWPPNPANPLMLIKNFDCSKSIGPSISVGEADVDDVRVETFVNGERRQAFSSKDMIFSFAEVLEYFSRDMTFHPGDVISMGTGAGTTVDSIVPNAEGKWPKERFLKPGDTVEVKSPVVGSLVSNVAAKAS